MDAYDSLHGVRSKVDRQRQPRHARNLDALEGMLKKWTIRNPYNLTDGQYGFLLRNASAFIAVCQGLPSRLLENGACFRLTAIRKVITHTSSGRLKTLYTDLRNWRYIYDDYARTPNWMPLSAYVSGSLSGPRGFTWWTTLGAAWDKPVPTGHRLGLPNEYLPSIALLLRCPVAYLQGNKRIFVPSVIDAFDSPIFHATRDTEAPKAGLTIDISSGIPVQSEVAELVAKDIPVDKIECIPLRISEAELKVDAVYLSDILPLMKSYYLSLSE